MSNNEPFLTGDLLVLADQGHFDIIVHGCNCFNTMGAGIAKKIALHYPSVREADLATRRGDPSKLGTYTYAKVPTAVGGSLMVVNAYTQYYYYRANYQGEGKFDINHLYRVLNQLFTQYPLAKIGIPAIGSGLGRASLEPLIELVRWYTTRHYALTLVTLTTLPLGT